MIERTVTPTSPPGTTATDLLELVPDCRGWVDVFVSVPVKIGCAVVQRGVDVQVAKPAETRIRVFVRRLIDPAVRTWGDA